MKYKWKDRFYWEDSNNEFWKFDGNLYLWIPRQQRWIGRHNAHFEQRKSKRAEIVAQGKKCRQLSPLEVLIIMGEVV